MFRKHALGFVALFVFAILLCGEVSADSAHALGEHDAHRLLIGTTTSLDATKVLDTLADMFERENNVDVQWVAVGTGQALEYGRNCDVDLVMVHDREAEDTFIEQGYGVDRRVFGYNYFLLVGPENDPAHVSGMNGTAAFAAIQKAAQNNPAIIFVSRGDNSGTHSREKLLWKEAGYDYTSINSSPWYREAGAGMGQTLAMANELSAYTLTDSASWATYQSNLSLVPVVENDNAFMNVYAVMRVNDAVCPQVNTEMAKKWINFMISDKVQDLLQSYGSEKNGIPYFNPGRGNASVMGVSDAETKMLLG